MPNTSSRWRASPLVGALLGVILIGCGSCESAVEPSGSSEETAATEALPAQFARGICLAHSWEQDGQHGYGTRTSASTLRELRALGANWVSLTPFGFMDSLNDPTVRHVGQTRGGERDDLVRAEIREAKECGLSVLLKPHIWVSGGLWRAEIAQEDWEGWFASYTEWILGYARMAEQEGVSILAVGTELRSSAGFESHWRSLIAQIREIFHGRLVYCANWDALDAVSFWDAVDYVGVQFYPPIADAPNAEEQDMALRLAAQLDRIGELSEDVQRPVILTEVGYKSTIDGAVRPYEWTERGDSAVDEAMQARAYRVLFDGVRSRPWIEGLYIWKWMSNPDSGEEGPRGFSPRGKAAEQVLRESFGTPAGSEAQTAAPEL